MLFFKGFLIKPASFTTPSDIIPSNCQNIAIDTENYDKSQKIDQILSRAKSYQYDDYSNYRSTSTVGNHPASLHPECLKIQNLFGEMISDMDFYKLLDEREQIMNRRISIESDISRLKGTYDTVLLEKIANQPKSQSISAQFHPFFLT